MVKLIFTKQELFDQYLARHGTLDVVEALGGYVRISTNDKYMWWSDYHIFQKRLSNESEDPRPLEHWPEWEAIPER